MSHMRILRCVLRCVLLPVEGIKAVYRYLIVWPLFSFRVQAYWPAVTGVSGRSIEMIIRPRTALAGSRSLGLWMCDHFTEFI